MPDYHNYANGVYGKKLQKEFWDNVNESKAMDQKEVNYKHLVSRDKPFFPGLRREHADR
tara:strand:+ start:514 stop:690 length:177 start_codon:yes stop_codon:yes gene_type:complete